MRRARPSGRRRGVQPPRAGRYDERQSRLASFSPDGRCRPREDSSLAQTAQKFIPAQLLESRGVEFERETMDNGVCFQAYFHDPDGNALILHHRYAPPGVKPTG
jgi:hypothetical protein